MHCIIFRMIGITAIGLTLNILSVHVHCPAIWILLQAFKSQHFARSQNLAAVQISPATSQLVVCRNRAHQGANSKGYSNYQQQWQQLTPTLELPIGASWQHSPPPVQRQPTPHEVKTCCMILL
ncbi:uncharacterized protein LOC124688009 [Lolium rigidum]|uniref:uncharacterized protein LOC124688009 n=1 Tax=Lolium rigidum TaxID=89674 RepID=UPI001F5E247E|nr:uncharacterized protein LOC124688009 [Lolium rigidum]